MLCVQISHLIRLSHFNLALISSPNISIKTLIFFGIDVLCKLCDSSAQSLPMASDLTQSKSPVLGLERLYQI